jgi:hypothetical protein
MILNIVDSSNSIYPLFHNDMKYIISQNLQSYQSTIVLVAELVKSKPGYSENRSPCGLHSTLTPAPWQSQHCRQKPEKPTVRLKIWSAELEESINRTQLHKLIKYPKFQRKKNNSLYRQPHTDFQPSGSRQAVILVLIPGRGPGSRVSFPPKAFTASAVL